MSTKMTDGSSMYTRIACINGFVQKPLIFNSFRNGDYYEFYLNDGRYYYLTVIRSTAIRKYRIWYFGGAMYQQLVFAEDANPIVSLDISELNKCKLQVADWNYITVIWEEVNSGLY